eukprot:gnl/MRDRNA2_/MRDRNA2_122080_c0_seq1.p1 gnl/MRDRNA2_/MRDRNA2_122080_c0~~gnl/MRDRNA2_/MRDRNA2_122080_c0_seq1.p1  ORF type:complete len:424 (-),score=69.17 gnl/MRDRNA2_/MRDRNA2_122080_c0_seq1:128-1360(-)
MVRPFLPSKKAQLSSEVFNACRRGKWDQVDELLRRRADPNVSSNSSQTSSLIVAVQKSSLRGCKSLLQCKADVNRAEKSSGMTALMTGCRLSCPPELVCELLEGRADVNARTRDSRTPLMLAAESGARDIMSMLLANGADVNAEALSAEVNEDAMGMDREVVNQFFKQKLRSVLPDYIKHRRKLAYQEEESYEVSQDLEGYEDIVEAELPGAPPQQVDGLPDTLPDSLPDTLSQLEFADLKEPIPESPIREGKEAGESPVGRHSFSKSSVVTELGFFLSRVAPLRPRDTAKGRKLTEDELKVHRAKGEALRKVKGLKSGTGDTALSLAADRGHSAACELLLVCRADVRMSNCSGETPLHIAARKGHHEVCRVLLRSCPHKAIVKSAMRTAHSYGNEACLSVIAGYSVLAA